jgi:hypothetical protein
MDGFMAKPIEIDDVLKVVGEVAAGTRHKRPELVA